MNKKRAQSIASPFWYWSNWKAIGSSRDGTGAREGARTIYEQTIRPPDEKWRAIVLGHGPIDPACMPLFVGNLEVAAQADDCPWPVAEMFIVSDRLRKILEKAAPGNCQFFPMKVTCNGKPCDLVYWVLYVDSVDCADQEQSGRTHDGSIWDPVIVESRVPSSVQLFRVWDPVKDSSDLRILVRDSLRRLLIKEKVTGCGFYRPRMSSPLPPAG
jgi:hypothetical protein